MSLKKKIDEDIKSAMRNQDKDKLNSLRAVKSLILLEETAHKKQNELCEEDEHRLLAKAVKQRREAATIFQQEGRKDLYDKEMKECAIITAYMPRQLSEEEVSIAIKKIIAETGSSSPQDMGKVMRLATQTLSGQSDGKMMAAITKSLLST